MSTRRPFPLFFTFVILGLPSISSGQDDGLFPPPPVFADEPTPALLDDGPDSELADPPPPSMSPEQYGVTSDDGLLGLEAVLSPDYCGPVIVDHDHAHPDSRHAGHQHGGVAPQRAGTVSTWEPLHYRFPYYSYRRPGVGAGPASATVTIVW